MFSRLGSLDLARNRLRKPDFVRRTPAERQFSLFHWTEQFVLILMTGMIPCSSRRGILPA